jgi:hypothetical protein
MIICELGASLKRIVDRYQIGYSQAVVVDAMMMVMIISPFGQLGLWAPPSGL